MLSVLLLRLRMLNRWCVADTFKKHTVHMASYPFLTCSFSPSALHGPLILGIRSFLLMCL